MPLSVLQRSQEGPQAAGGRLSIADRGMLLAVCLLVFCVHLGGARALTAHESYVGGGARQMLEEGDWILPRLGDRLWLEKPPLLHWLAVLSARALGGFSELAVRLPSALAGMGVVLLVAGLAARWFGRTAGLLAGFIQCTAIYMVTYARLAEADMLLNLMVVAAISLFIRLQGSPASPPSPVERRARLLFWALLGLSSLAKGLLFGAFMVLAPCLVWLLLRREKGSWRRLLSPAGMAIAALLTFAWPAAVLIREPAALELWVELTFGRAVGSTSYSNPWWYYFANWPWQVLPWTPFVLWGAGPSLRRAWQDRSSPDRFIWCWLLVPFACLSLSRGKHHHYLMYCLPALSPVAALGLLRMSAALPIQGTTRRALLWTAAALAAVSAAAAPFFVAKRLPAWRADAWFLGALCAAAIASIAFLVLRKRPRAGFLVLAATVVLCLLQVHLSILPRRDPYQWDKAFLLGLRSRLPPDSLLIATGMQEVAAPLFYAERPLVAVWETRDIARVMGGSRAVYVVARAGLRSELESLGAVRPIAESERSRRESGPNDRLTLFALTR